ncbi:MAG: DUF4148 domain-containing protein [Ramlibacter sp.]
MKASNLFLALSAFAMLSVSAARADEADASQYALSFKSVRSAAEVKAEAAAAPHITNGGTGFIGVTSSSVSPTAVRQEAIAAARSGMTSRGEIGI